MKTTRTTRVRRLFGIAHLSILVTAFAAITSLSACEAEPEDPYGDIVDAETATCQQQAEADRSDACRGKLAKQAELQQLKRFHHVLGLACVRDVKKFCSEIGPVTDRESMADCLDAHQEDLMPRCRSKVRIKAHIRIGKLFDQACSNDMDEYCGHVSRNADPQEFKSCMREHIDDVAPVCKDTLDGKIVTKREQQRLERVQRRERREAAEAALNQAPVVKEAGDTE